MVRPPAENAPWSCQHNPDIRYNMCSIPQELSDDAIDEEIAAQDLLAKQEAAKAVKAQAEMKAKAKAVKKAKEEADRRAVQDAAAAIAAAAAAAAFKVAQDNAAAPLPVVQPLVAHAKPLPATRQPNKIPLQKSRGLNPTAPHAVRLETAAVETPVVVVEAETERGVNEYKDVD